MNLELSGGNVAPATNNKIRTLAQDPSRTSLTYIPHVHPSRTSLTYLKGAYL